MDPYDVYTQFERRHLTTHAEQTVYAALVSHRGRLWSAPDPAASAVHEPDDAARSAPPG